MSSLSKIVVSGRVIRPPEKRFTPNTNVAVTDFTIAVESNPRQDGTVESHPVKVIAWRDLAERLAQDVKKGDLVAVDGRLQLNSYTNSEGQRRRDVEIEASTVENLTQIVNGGGSASVPAEAGRSVVRAAAKPSKPTEAAPDDLDAIFASEDEIPF
ncbi:MAG: single-stranded DNA-binding protein [Candidatus Obscuribacterales bacterium]|jgi:single-strand DNA-binding protein|nr:single-stranded DNA-binding protein [Candidatus Obscuribacterales bacterium]